METMLELRRALRDMRDFTLTCGKLHQSDRQEYVHIRWQDEEPRFNKGWDSGCACVVRWIFTTVKISTDKQPNDQSWAINIYCITPVGLLLLSSPAWLHSLLTHSIISPIDGKSMESITCIKAHQRLEYRANGKVIRWTEVHTDTIVTIQIRFLWVTGFTVWWIDHYSTPQVFFLQREEPYNGPNSYAHHNRLTERLARAFCLALCNSLSLLKEDGMTKLALRVTLDGQKVR